MADLEADYRITLTEEYESRAARNPRYSRNAFARLLGMNPTYLSKLTNGKILLSLELAERVTQRLGLSPDKRKEFLLSVADEQQCHSLYELDPSLTHCDPAVDEKNKLPAPRKKN